MLQESYSVDEVRSGFAPYSKWGRERGKWRPSPDPSPTGLSANQCTALVSSHVILPRMLLTNSTILYTALSSTTSGQVDPEQLPCGGGVFGVQAVANGGGEGGCWMADW